MQTVTSLQSIANLILQVDLVATTQPGSISDRVLTGTNLDAITETLTFGSAAGQVNCFYFERITLAPGNTDLDLRDLYTDRPPAGDRNFTLIKWFYLRLVNPAAGSFVLLGNYGANGWKGFLRANNVAITIDDDLFIKTPAGWTVSPTEEFLRINNPGSTTLSADLVLIGVGEVAIELEDASGFLLLE